MENAPVTPTVRTTKVRSAKAVVSKSSSKKAPEKVPAIIAAAPTPKRKVLAKKSAAVPVADLTAMIAIAAYYLAEQRHFAPGHDVEDWLAAEQQLRASGNSH
jgi:Protein of unknown function (DUF2934)